MIISFRPLIRVNLCKHKFYIAMDDGAKVSVPLSGLIFVNYHGEFNGTPVAIVSVPLSGLIFVNQKPKKPHKDPEPTFPSPYRGSSL